jgi:hypothetical protein
MITLLRVRPKPSPRSAQISRRGRESSQECPERGRDTGVGIVAGKAHLAVIVSAAAERNDAAVAAWQAELRLAECSRALPLAWPLTEWLDNYRDLLVTALTAQKNEPGKAPREGEIVEFLRLMLAGRDKSAANLVRTLTRPYPFSAKTSRLRRVQALFAAIRPARSLAEALDFRVVTSSAAQHSIIM